MPTEQTQQTENSPVLDLQDHSAKIGAIDELLGLAAEEPSQPEKATSPETGETSLSEALAEAEKPTGSGESQQAAKPPKTLNELAERLGVDVTDLYSMEIPAQADGGENHTLGSLKDEAAKHVDHAGRELALEERRVQLENDQVKQRGELELILSSLPPEAIKPEVLQKAKAEREVFLDREAARVLDVIPEWNDDQAKRGDMAGIGEHMAEYGFDQNHIDQVADHRMLRYMRDNFNRKQLVERALENTKPVTRIPKTKRTQPVKTPTPPPAATPDSALNDQLAAIDGLLKK